MFSKLIFVQFVKTSNISFTSTQASFPNRCWNVSNLIGISPPFDFSCFRLTSNLRFKLFVPNLDIRSGLGLAYLWSTRFYSWDVQYKFCYQLNWLTDLCLRCIFCDIQEALSCCLDYSSNHRIHKAWYLYMEFIDMKSSLTGGITSEGAFSVWKRLWEEATIQF